MAVGREWRVNSQFLWRLRRRASAFSRHDLFRRWGAGDSTCGDSSEAEDIKQFLDGALTFQFHTSPDGMFFSMGVCVFVDGGAGLGPVDAARATYLLIVYVFGSIVLDAAELGEVRRRPPEAERIAARRAGFSAIPAKSYPLSAAAGGAMAGYISTEQYVWGLRKVLDGITAGLTSAPESLQQAVS